MLRRDEVREHAASALWVLPGLASLAALLAGLGVSRVEARCGHGVWAASRRRARGAGQARLSSGQCRAGLGSTA